MPNDIGSRSAGSDLRRTILDTTRHLLVEEGYNNLSMRKIARSAGCSATSIYLHFDNKDALFHALIDEGMDRLHDTLSDARVDDPAESLERLCRAYIQFGVENPEYYEVMFMLHPERMARYPAEKYRRARRNVELFGSALARGVDSGQFASSDPDLGAGILWTTLHGAVALLIAQRMDVRVDRAAYIDAVIAHALAGFRPAAERKALPTR